MDISRDAGGGGGGDRHWPADETVTTSQLEESRGPGSSKFLFVHVTGDSAAYKHGNRPAIRSHVRSTARAARGYKEDHNMARKGKRKAIRPKNPPLEPQHHHSNCPASLTISLPPRSSLTFSIPDADVLASGTQGLHIEQQALSEDTTMINTNPSPFALAGDSFIADVRNVGEQRKASVSYCKACGRPLKGEGYLIQAIERINSTKRSSGWKLTTTPSPVEILGAGRMDPFSSYPMKSNDKVNELLDHLVTYKIPGLFPDDEQTSGPNSVSIAWLGACQKLPLLFHALVLSSSIHLDIVRWSKFTGNSPTILSYKLTIFRLLGEIFREGTPARDEVILAILTLSSHEIMPLEEEKRNPFNSPLKNLQFLNIYGSIQFVPEHMKAVLDLITLKGGIENVELPGLAECLVAGDIVFSMNSASKPIFPPLRSHETYITAVRAWATSSSRKFVQKLGSKFWNLQDHGLTDDMLQVFDAVGSLTIAIDHYLKGKPDAPTVGVIARTRTAIQKRLLLLPSDDELNIIPLLCPYLYEACRLTGLIYGIAVVFPIPKPYDMLRTLSQCLKVSIEKFEICGSKSLEVQHVFLWMLMLGGIAALDKVERLWFVSQLVRLVGILRIDWDSAEEILESFLWLDSACGSGGRLLWAEVVESMDSTV